MAEGGPGGRGQKRGAPYIPHAPFHAPLQHGWYAVTPPPKPLVSRPPPTAPHLHPLYGLPPLPLSPPPFTPHPQPCPAVPHPHPLEELLLVEHPFKHSRLKGSCIHQMVYERGALLTVPPHTTDGLHAEGGVRQDKNRGAREMRWYIAGVQA